jgi:uncharacterized protein (TIGR02996 family)
MSDSFELTEEYIYRVAPDGKSCKAAVELVKEKAFSQARMSDHGRRLEARCRGGAMYHVLVDLTKPDHPATSCDCYSYKRPCKHALGLLFLAVRAPDTFDQDESSRRTRRRPEEIVTSEARQEAAVPAPPPPKDTGEAILQAVLAEPDDDAPRLIYADWLADNGQEDRAEFIRLQLELFRLPTNDARGKQLRQREKQLWSANKKAWLATLPLELRKRKYIAFHCGFFEELTHAPSTWTTCADELFRSHPVHRLKPKSPFDRHAAGDLAVVPHLSRIRAIVLYGTIKTPAQTLHILFHTPFLSGLTTLDAHQTEFGTRELGTLAASPAASRLKNLELSAEGLGPKGVETLVEPTFNGLKRLVLHGFLPPTPLKKLQERFGDRLVRAE